MASSSLQFASSLLLIAAAVSLLISPAMSQTCKSQTFTNTTTFANCVDLPTLNAFLHYTYDPSPPANPNPTLSIAFIAPPASPDGWVAWALNPTATGMIGAQALIAFRESNGSVVVKTFNISSYSSISESEISYEVISKRAEYSGGVMTIFATLELPAAAGVELNQVWQVGAAVSGGVPAMHSVSRENLNSRGTLELESTASEDRNGESPASAPTGCSGSGPPTPTRQSGNDSGGSSVIYGSGIGLYGVLVLLGVIFGS